MELELTGVNGEVRAAYRVAAHLGRWRLTTIGPTLYRLDAEHCKASAGYLGYSPLVLRVPTSKGLVMEVAVNGEVPPPDEEGKMLLFAEGLPTFKQAG